MGTTNVEFCEGFLEDLPVSDGWADVVIANGVINLCPDKAATFAEIWRVLRWPVFPPCWPTPRVAPSSSTTEPTSPTARSTHPVTPSHRPGPGSRRARRAAQVPRTEASVSDSGMVDRSVSGPMR